MQNKKLNPVGWDINQNLYDPIRKRLIEIAKKFLESIEVPIEIKNIYLTGSLCSYEWTPTSDWDLHIIVKSEEGYCGKLTVDDYFDVKSKVFNKERSIFIKGYPVEVNIKEKEDLLKDKAVYDLIKAEWVAEPVIPDKTLNNPEVLEKAKKIQDMVDSAIDNEASIEELKKIRDIIKNSRKTGLASDGEFSTGNLVFKKLRHTGYIKKLYDYKAKIQDKELSMESFTDYIRKNNLFPF
jgi:hypothetical protein